MLTQYFNKFTPPFSSSYFNTACFHIFVHFGAGSGGEYFTSWGGKWRVSYVPSSFTGVPTHIQ